MIRRRHLKSRRLWVIAILLLGAVIVPFVLSQPEGELEQLQRDASLRLDLPVMRDLEQIEERGRLVMLTTTNSTSYFVYRGELMGFEFGMLWAFARDMGLELDVKLVDSPGEAYQKLSEGVGDVIAAQITPRGELQGRVAFTEPLYETPPALVQRRDTPEAADFPEASSRALDEGGSEGVTVRARLIERPSDLAGRTVWVPEVSATFDRLVEIRDSMSGEMEIVELDEGFEELVAQVAAGEITLTAGPRNIATLKQASYANLVVRPSLGPPIETVWAVRRNAPDLEKALNRWLAKERNGNRYRRLYDKYFVDREGYIERQRSGFLTAETSRLSEWDELIERNATSIGWDWRLLASQMYQESKFKPRARSWAGAMGLLQLMPATAREFGVTSPFDPEQNVAGAVRYLAWLENYWESKVPEPEERLKFILASYNAGQGHVQDARRLATKYGDDANSWDDVSYWLLQKSKKRFYLDPVSYYGYCRGIEPVTYVAYILERFRHYQEVIPDEASAEEDGGGSAEVADATDTAGDRERAARG